MLYPEELVKMHSIYNVYMYTCMYYTTIFIIYYTRISSNTRLKIFKRIWQKHQCFKNVHLFKNSNLFKNLKIIKIIKRNNLFF